VSKLPTPAFFYGLKQDEEILVTIEEGKTVMIRLQYVSEPDEAGFRTVTFDLNGQARRISVRDRAFKSTKPQNQKIGKPGDIGAPLQGRLNKIQVKVGDVVKKNQPLFVIEAMKMESIVSAPAAGKVTQVVLPEGTVVEQDDWVVTVQD
jgi:pyruvate carboxylase